MTDPAPDRPERGGDLLEVRRVRGTPPRSPRPIPCSWRSRRASERPRPSRRSAGRARAGLAQVEGLIDAAGEARRGRARRARPARRGRPRPGATIDSRTSGSPRAVALAQDCVNVARVARRPRRARRSAAAAAAPGRAARSRPSPPKSMNTSPSYACTTRSWRPATIPRSSVSTASASSARSRRRELDAVQRAQRPEHGDHERARAAEPDALRDRRAPADVCREPPGSNSRANRRTVASTSAFAGSRPLASGAAPPRLGADQRRQRDREHRAAVTIRRIAGERRPRERGAASALTGFTPRRYRTLRDLAADARRVDRRARSGSRGASCSSAASQVRPRPPRAPPRRIRSRSSASLGEPAGAPRPAPRLSRRRQQPRLAVLDQRHRARLRRPRRPAGRSPAPRRSPARRCRSGWRTGTRRRSRRRAASSSPREPAEERRVLPEALAQVLLLGAAAGEHQVQPRVALRARRGTRRRAGRRPSPCVSRPAYRTLTSPGSSPGVAQRRVEALEVDAAVPAPDPLARRSRARAAARRSPGWARGRRRRRRRTSPAPSFASASSCGLAGAQPGVGGQLGVVAADQRDVEHPRQQPGARSRPARARRGGRGRSGPRRARRRSPGGSGRRS